jgi:hypothetical protein
MADFSSRGLAKMDASSPTSPPGTWIASLQSQSATDETLVSDFELPIGGTSQSSPHVSGAAAVFVQMVMKPRRCHAIASLGQSGLINCAVDMIRWRQ